MTSVPTAYYQGYVQGSRPSSEVPDYSTFQHLHWMADVVSNKIIHQQAVQASRYTEHHVYYHFFPTEPGASANSPSRTPRSFFSTPNWSNPSSAESSPECRPTCIEAPHINRISVGSRRGAVSYNPPPPAYNSELTQAESIQPNPIPRQLLQTQTECLEPQGQQGYAQVLYNPPLAERVLTPKEFVQELQRLLAQERGGQTPMAQFLIQGEVTPVYVWRPDPNGPFLVQHYSPSGREDAISVAHIVNGSEIVWCPPPSAEYF